MKEDKTVVVLAMHGVPPSDFPRRELGEFFALHARFEHAAATGDPAWPRYVELEKKVRDWPRTPGNDPYHTASFELARALSAAVGMDVVVGFNEFCSPGLDAAIDSAAGSGAKRVIVITPMMTPGGEHSEKDIPAAIERARKRHPDLKLEYAWPFAVEDVAAFLADHVRRHPR